MIRKAAKRDANEAEIVRLLRQIGCKVVHLSDKDIPDLLVGFMGSNYLMEVKITGKKLTPGQRDFHDAWRGQIDVVRTPQDAFKVIGFEEDNEI